MILRRLLLLAFVALCASYLPGCATEEWTRSDRPELKPVWIVVAQEMVQSVCRHNQGFVANACAIYGEDCLIVAEQDEAHSPRWLVEHERKHCKGFDHPDPVNFPQLTSQ
jgi:hypothetical protein